MINLYLKFSELTPSTYFWRKGNHHRWLKASNHLVYSFDNPNEDKQIENLDEIVLIDPVYCYSCQQNILYDKHCNCGGVSEFALPEDEIRRLIIDWTGNPQPHL